MKTIELTCIQCNKNFLRSLGEHRRKRKPKTGPFCSKGCHNTYRCTGKPLSQEHREKLKGRTPWNKGLEWPQEIRDRISKAVQGKRTGADNPNWKGGHYLRQGYMMIRINGRYKTKHVHIMEEHLGRPMYRGEIVHHKNEDRLDNRLENLEVLTISEHMRLHHPNGVLQKAVEKTCIVCEETFMGRRIATLCSEQCKRQRQREYERRWRKKRRNASS